METVFVITPSNIIGAVIVVIFVVGAILVWLDATSYERHKKKMQKKQDAQSKGHKHVPHLKELEVTLTDGSKRKAMLKDGYVRFLDCTHMMQNTICDRDLIASWKYWEDRE